MKIDKILAREILDSRGNPTVEADVILNNGAMGRAAVPSGASTGKREALELRDNDKSRYLGKGVRTAVGNVLETIAPALKGKAADDLIAIDKTMLELDGTESKSKLGANALLAVSMAVCRAGALAKKTTLVEHLRDIYYGNYLKGQAPKGCTMPTPMMNILNGGAHADNNLSIQEFMIMPVCGRNFSEALRAGVEIFHELKMTLKEKHKSTNVGDEGGFAPELDSNIETLDIISEAVGRAGYRVGHDIFFAIDAAASEFYKDGMYQMQGAPKPSCSSDELINYYGELGGKYPLASIEDGLAEDDWDGWKNLTKARKKNMMLVGDDLFVTNEKILQEGIDKGVGNAILIKLNQIGTVSETLATIALARQNSYNTVISHRSGETEDTFLADLCVATDAGLIKTGSASRSDRMAKYNQLLRIEEQLGDKAEFRGLQALGWKF